ncbi:hypothetical protein SAMN05444392_107172 [Seinonella peptonophila]|uniref:Uncharacterized protein n=1 Tax=Seinonella peptonophila TaxID=112248 RepID=A0A1M4YW38_9BACL|nr:hypothetical protein [Seinonella peptonophila]SHF09777.1 hypothetical protein SAMN05444392_107172 [Seinonella peptonophila]
MGHNENPRWKSILSGYLQQRIVKLQNDKDNLEEQMGAILSTVEELLNELREVEMKLQRLEGPELEQLSRKLENDRDKFWNLLTICELPGLGELSRKHRNVEGKLRVLRQLLDSRPTVDMFIRGYGHQDPSSVRETWDEPYYVGKHLNKYLDDRLFPIDKSWDVYPFLSKILRDNEHLFTFDKDELWGKAFADFEGGDFSGKTEESRFPELEDKFGLTFGTGSDLFDEIIGLAMELRPKVRTHRGRSLDVYVNQELVGSFGQQKSTDLWISGPIVRITFRQVCCMFKHRITTTEIKLIVQHPIDDQPGKKQVRIEFINQITTDKGTVEKINRETRFI